MTEFTLPFGSTSLSFDLPPVFTTDYLTAEIGAPLENPEAEIQKALETPIGKVQRTSAADVQSIGIAINDKTRPVPDPNPLDLLLAYFDQLGFRKDQITLFIGSGTHKPAKRSSANTGSSFMTVTAPPWPTLAAPRAAHPSSSMLTSSPAT